MTRACGPARSLACSDVSRGVPPLQCCVVVMAIVGRSRIMVFTAELPQPTLLQQRNHMTWVRRMGRKRQKHTKKRDRFCIQQHQRSLNMNTTQNVSNEHNGTPRTEHERYFLSAAGGGLVQ